VIVDGWPGTQGHNWGREHAFLYAWSHCNVLLDEQGRRLENSYFEGLSARVKLGPAKTPFLTVAWLRLHGVDLPFTAFSDILRSRSAIEERGRYRWTFTLTGEAGTLAAEAEAMLPDLVGLYYLNPDGSMTYCLNSKISRLALSFRPKHGAPIELRSEASALEIGTRNPDHGVPMAV
jgi:hypothetical protein